MGVVFPKLLEYKAMEFNGMECSEVGLSGEYDSELGSVDSTLDGADMSSFVTPGRDFIETELIRFLSSLEF